ncbi:MAG TPA: carbon-nitrogen hydrolase family protein [Armatimonadota bacterium]|nr:carbon-nitrogen hydrolase family protein [Armatimonadota bacterium]
MADGANLLTNADFSAMGEEGVPEGWQLAAGNPLTAPELRIPADDGARWARFTMRENAASMGCLSQQVELPHGCEAVRVQVAIRCRGDARALDHSVVRLYWDSEPRLYKSGPGWLYRHFPDYDVINARSARVDAVIPVPMPGANRLRLDLMAHWSPGGSVAFGQVSVAPCDPPPPRRARLAVVQGYARGTPADACAWAAEQVAGAARQGADLVCLGEAINFAGLGIKPLDACEPIPDGPMSSALSCAAAEHNINVVAGIYERDGDIAYNSAALFGREGQLIGVFRKVHLPSPEVDWGFTPGNSFPVFDTDIGRVGMMVCYDHHFAESARALALNGAEIICVPIWGDGRADDTAWPATARTHAIENGVFYVAAIYSQRQSCVIDRDGMVLVNASGEDGVYTAEVDLTPYAASLHITEEGQNLPRSFKAVYRRERIPEAYRPISEW